MALVKARPQTRGGLYGGINDERLEILWGSRGKPGDAAIRKRDILEMQSAVEEVSEASDSLKKTLASMQDEVSEMGADLVEMSAELKTAQQEITTINDQTLTAINQHMIIIDGQITALDNDLEAISSTVGLLSFAIENIETHVSQVSISAGTAVTVSAAPTADDFNKLVSDTKNLRDELTAMKKAITG